MSCGYSGQKSWVVGVGEDKCRGSEKKSPPKKITIKKLKGKKLIQNS